MAGAEETLHGKAHSVNATMNDTHDPQRQSWVLSANRPGNAFPIQNLPFGVFAGAAGPTVGVAIGDQVLDLRGCSGLLAPLPAGTVEACTASTLNPLMALGPVCWSALRARLSDLLRADHPQAADHQRALAPHLYAMAEVTMLKPAVIGNYTDFYASIDHATNVGRLFRPDNPLLPNYKYVPIGYHGRASSIVLSGSTVKRPEGTDCLLSRVGAPVRAYARRSIMRSRLDFLLAPAIGWEKGSGSRMLPHICLACAC